MSDQYHYHVAKDGKAWTLCRVMPGELRHVLLGTFSTKAEAVATGRLLAGWRGRVTTKANQL